VLAGQVVDAGEFREFRNLGPLLRRKPGDRSDEEGSRWDPTSREVSEILRLMMFHEAAGGRSHTRLLNRYQQRLDYTHLLDKGRAILVGRAREHASELLRDGKSFDGSDDKTWTYYRLVLPVTLQP
jgi:hypothetical protein